jgi:molecular chaperone DnaJ
VTHSRGPFLLQTTCPGCHGLGSVAEHACKECHGTGQVEVERSVKVTFPAGIDDDQTLRVPGQGLAGTQGGPAGHLYVDVKTEPDPRFERDGADLVHPLSISYPQASLGVELEVPSLEDDDATLRVKVPAGSQPGDTVRVRGQGVPRLDGGGRGDLVVLLQLSVPTKLSRKARSLLEQLQHELDAK